MREATNKKVNHIFQRETAILKKSKAVLKDEEVAFEDLKKSLESLTDHYEELLDQSKLITKVSDRQQKKIIRTSQALESNNKELQETIDALLADPTGDLTDILKYHVVSGDVRAGDLSDALTKAKVGRKATTITLGIAIVLFLFSEGFLEPQIDQWVSEHDFADFGFDNVNFIGLGLKALLALLIRPIEKIVENRMLAQAMKEEKKA